MMRELLERAEAEAYARGKAEGLKAGRAAERRLAAHKDPANIEAARKFAWAESGTPLNLVDGFPVGWPESVKDKEVYAENYIDTIVLREAPASEPEPPSPNVERLRQMIGGTEP